MKHPLYLALLTLGLSSAFGQISFSPSRELTNYAARPIDTTAVDLDLDGDLDIITHEEYSGWVKWYLNDGVGNFSKGGEWYPPIDTTRELWQGLGFMDYDEDGYLDILGLLETNYDTTQAICLVRGLEGATFEVGFTKILVSEYDPHTEEGELERVHVGLQDFDGDGRKDIVFQNHIVFLGDDPLIATETNVDLDRVNSWDEDLPLIDWNEDGMPDLIDLSRSQELTVRVNEGHGNFSETQIFEIPLLETVSSPYMDIYPIRSTVNKDSMELCLSYQVDDIKHLSILTRSNDGSLRVSTTVTQDELLPPEIAGSWVRGIPSERIFITTFDDRDIPEVDTYQLIWDGAQLSAEPLVSSIPSRVFIIRAMSNEDFDGNGTSDLLIETIGPDRTSTAATDEVFWLKDSIGGEYDSIRNSIVAPSFTQTLCSAPDIDFDGLPDLISLQTIRGRIDSGRLVLWKNNNNGESFTKSNLIEEENIFRVLTTFELDGSLSRLGGEFSEIDWLPGGTGMLVSRGTNPRSQDRRTVAELSYIFQTSSGDFDLIDYFKIEDTALESLYFEDLNGDGNKDLIYNKYTNQQQEDPPAIAIEIRFGSTQPRAFDAPIQVLENASLWYSIKDLDQDGDLDLLIGYSESAPLWLENKDGDFIARQELEEEPISIHHSNYAAITRLDLDGDGDLDQVAAMTTNRIREWTRMGWFENKEGHYQTNMGLDQLTPFTKTRTASRDSHLLADLDNDGVKDLVVGSSSYSRLEWFKITHAAQPPAYTAWATSKGVTGHSASPLADWDGDSWTNWEEFAFGSDPNQIDPNHPGRPQISVKEAGPTLTFSRRRDAANDGIIYQHFQSTNLRSWASWIPAEAHLAPIDEGYEKVSIPLDRPRGFFRVQPMLPAGDQ